MGADLSSSEDLSQGTTAETQIVGSDRALLAWSGLVAVYTVVSFGGPLLWAVPEDRLYTYSNAAFALLQYGAIVLVLLVIARPRGLRETLALTPPTSWKRSGAIGLLLFAGMIALLAILDPLLHSGDAQNLASEWDPTRVIPFAINAAVIALIAPVVEELWFRGLGFTLLQRYGTTIAIVVTAGTFALMHGLVEMLPIAVAFGLGLAYLRCRTGSIYPGIILHVLINTLGVAATTLGS